MAHSMAVPSAQRALSLLPSCMGLGRGRHLFSHAVSSSSQASCFPRAFNARPMRQMCTSATMDRAPAPTQESLGPQPMSEDEWESLPRRSISAVGNLVSEWSVRSVNTRKGPTLVAGNKLVMEDDGYEEDRARGGFKPRLDLTVWGDDAKVVADAFHQGDNVFIKGFMRLDRYPDRNTPGRENITVKVTVQEIARVLDSPPPDQQAMQ